MTNETAFSVFIRKRRVCLTGAFLPRSAQGSGHAETAQYIRIVVGVSAVFAVVFAFVFAVVYADVDLGVVFAVVNVVYFKMGNRSPLLLLFLLLSLLLLHQSPSTAFSISGGSTMES